MKKTNVALHSARLRRSWTREFVSKKVGVSLTTYTKWELGQQIPPITSQKTLCEVFAMSSQELGFEEATHHPLDGYLNRPAPKHSPLPPIPQPKGEPARIAESCENWAESMGICWKIYMQGGHLELEKQLPDYFCNLKGPALFPGPAQVKAAHVLSEAYQLQALLKLHRADFIAAQISCTQAINYSQLANDRNIFIAAQIRMGNILIYHKQPRAALAAYEEASRHINCADHYISPLLHSLTFLGMGTLYAGLGSEKEAMQYLQLAVGIFPDEPEEDLAYVYMREDASLFILHEGLILLKIGISRDCLACTDANRRFQTRRKQAHADRDTLSESKYRTNIRA